MSFTFNKETRRSLRERIRDGINLIPGASTVVQAPGNILNSATGVVVGEKRGASQQPQQKSHSVDATTSSLLHLQEPTGGGGPASSIISKSEQSVVTASTSSYTPAAAVLQPISPSYLTAENSNVDHHQGGGGGGDGSRSESVSSCSSSNSSSPSKYRTYVVKPNDTITSIAASFDCTPSELMRVNRLITARVLFPGQVLKIPNKPKSAINNQPQQQPQNQNAAYQQQQSSHNALSNQHHHPDPATANLIESITYAQRKFLKIKVRHVTDGNGVVSGILLITPNAVMFDPNVSDPLVIEQGAETYGIIVPIEYIVGASIWSDICGMRVRGKEAFIPPGPRPVLWGDGEGKEKPEEKSEADDGNSSKIKEESIEEKKEEDSQENAAAAAAAAAAIAEEDSEATAADPTITPPPPVPPIVTATPPSSPSKLEQVTEHPLKEMEEGEGATNNNNPPQDNSNAAAGGTAPASSVSTWYFCLTIGRPKPGDNGNNALPGSDMVKSSRRAPFCVTYGQKNIVRPEFWFSVGKEQVPELFKYWMFWWPNIYGEVDFKAISDRGYDPIDWDNLSVLPDSSNNMTGGGGGSGNGSGGGTGSRASRGSNGEDGNGEEQSMAQELNELTKESWEMLKQPYAKLSSFITTRGSSIMKSSSHSSQSSVSDGMMGGHGGSSHGGHPHHSHHHSHGGQHQQHQSTSSSLFNSHHFSITNPMNSFFFESFSNISPNHSVFDDTDDDDDEFGSFEQVVTNEELRNLLAMGGEEMMAINLPDLIGGKSEILEEDDIRNITRHLTARAEGYPWTLIFSSSRDGFSLNSLYRRNSLMQEDSPVMMIVQDTNSRVFGALVSCSLHTSDSFYGTGQSFLFTLRPEFNVYKWTGENLFFVKGNHDGVWIGAGDGKFGLMVDGDLNCGRTETCQTYGNAPLTEPQDFIIKTLECWAFGNYVVGSNDLIGTAGSEVLK